MTPIDLQQRSPIAPALRVRLLTQIGVEGGCVDLHLLEEGSGLLVISDGTVSSWSFPPLCRDQHDVLTFTAPDRFAFLGVQAIAGDGQAAVGWAPFEVSESPIWLRNRGTSWAKAELAPLPWTAEAPLEDWATVRWAPDLSRCVAVGDFQPTVHVWAVRDEVRLITALRFDRQETIRVSREVNAVCGCAWPAGDVAIATQAEKWRARPLIPDAPHHRHIPVALSPDGGRLLTFEAVAARFEIRDTVNGVLTHRFNMRYPYEDTPIEEAWMGPGATAALANTGDVVLVCPHDEQRFPDLHGRVWWDAARDQGIPVWDPDGMLDLVEPCDHITPSQDGRLWALEQRPDGLVQVFVVEPATFG
jgi:hypothetical protein